MSMPNISLYHATYQAHLPKILEQGLRGAHGAILKNHEDSLPGVSYLATSAEVARSYAEASDTVPDEWLEQIVVLEVNTARLEPQLLCTDSNVQWSPGEAATTLEYHGVIEPAALKVMQ